MKEYKNREKQVYEEYWKYTAARTNIHTSDFIKALSYVIQAIDNKDAYFQNDLKAPSSYQKLQDKIIRLYAFKGKDPGTSARKQINQFVKTGFVSTGLKNYHPLTKDYITAESKEERDILVAKIFLENNKLSGSVKNTDPVETNRVKFLIRTLESCGEISRDGLLGIMYSNPDNYEKGYLNSNEVDRMAHEARKDDAFDRKYNQVGHFKSILKYLGNYITFIDDTLHFSDSVDELVKLAQPKGKPQRSAVEQGVFRDLLIVESSKFFGTAIDNWRSHDMLTGLDISRNKLVASHIWPYRSCELYAEYDPNNGILLAEDIDYLFDQGLISFDHKGVVLFKKDARLSEAWRKRLKDEKLNKIFLNKERTRYLSIHRTIYGFDKLEASELESLMQKPEQLIQ